jgi:hypothetical protein
MDWTEIPPKESSEICLYAFRRKVNCYQSGRGRFWPSCDISATKLAPELASCGMVEIDRKLSFIKILNSTTPPAGFPSSKRNVCVFRAGAPGGLPNPMSSQSALSGQRLILSLRQTLDGVSPRTRSRERRNPGLRPAAVPPRSGSDAGSHGIRIRREFKSEA